MNRITSLLIILISIVPVFVIGQDIYAFQWDKPYYTAGETVKYHVSVPSSFEMSQGVIQVKVFPNTRPDEEHISFIRTGANQLNSGYFDIRIDAISGSYTILLSALDKADMQVKEIGQGSFAVINPFVDAEIVDVMLDSEISDINTTVSVDFLNLNSSSDGIRVEVKNDKEAVGGVLSYFVTNLDQVYGDADPMGVRTYDIVSDVSISEPSSQLFYSNYAGDRSSGGSRVMGVYMSNSDDFVYVNAKLKNFILTVDDFYEPQRIQLIDQNLNVFPVDRSFKPERALSKAIDKRIVGKYVESFIDRRRIEQYFGSASKTTKTIIEADRKNSKAPTKKASQTFDLREYENFRILAKFFEEVSTPLKLEKVAGKYTAQLANPQYRGQSRLYFNGTPLFIVDGIVTTDLDFVANLDFNSINTVELFSSPSTLRDYYSMMGKSGIVKISTSIPNLSIPNSSARGIVELHGLQVKRDVSVNENYIQNRRYPVFGSTLESSANVPVGADGTISIVPPITNEKGSFLITALYRSQEGKVSVGHHTYTSDDSWK